MSKFYKKNGVFNLNDHFDEEVLEHELEQRKDPEIRVVHKINVVVLILFFLSLGLLIFSLYYAFFSEKTFVNIRTIQSGDIAVLHSKADFGETIDSFINFTSEDESSSYKFTVQNNNEHELNYNIKIQDKTGAGISRINLNYLNYSLYKNNNKISTGIISNLNNNILAKEKTLADSKDDYEIKLWSSVVSQDGYKFEIEVTD